MLLRQHLRLPYEFDPCGGKGVVALTRTKTTSPAANIHSVVVTVSLVLEVASLVFGRLHPRAALCSGGVSAFSRRFAALAEELSVGHLYTAGCLRGGGVVDNFEQHGNIG